MWQRRLPLLAVITLLSVIILYFISILNDPIMLYYGNRIRKSQYIALIQANRPAVENFGAYCISQPLYYPEQSICFDTEAELEQYSQRGFEISQQMEQQ